MSFQELQKRCKTFAQENMFSKSFSANYSLIFFFWQYPSLSEIKLDDNLLANIPFSEKLKEDI